MKDAGTLDLARAAIAKRRAPGQIAPSKYLPDVPRQVHAAGGKVDDARADFLAGNHPEVPPVVYHSTKGDFHAFRPMSHFGTEKAAHERHTFGSWHPAHLMMDTKLHNVSIIPAHISLKNPIDVGTEREWQSNRDTLRQVADWMGRRLDKKYAYARQKLKDLVGDPRWDEYPHAMEQRGADIIRDTGHDGIIYTNTIEDPGSRSFITLGPEQVKSAISAREFDPENPDMTKAEGGPVDFTHEKAKRTMFQTPKHVQDTMTSIADRHAAQVAAYEEAKRAGAFDNAQIGDIYQMPNGTREKIVDHHMIPAERWGSTEPLQATYQGHYPAVSTMPVDSSNQENMRRRAVQSLAGLTRVGGPLRVAKAGGGDVEDLGVHRFHRQLGNEVKSTMNDMVDAHQKALQAGVFDGYEVGDKLQGQVGPLTVKARYMAKWRPGGASDKTIQRMGQIPTLIDHNGVTYHPMLRLTGADGSEGDYPLDAVRGYPKFTGPRVAKKNGGGVKLYSKAAQIIRGLAKPEDNAEEMVRIALEKGAKKAELQHADVAPGMASRDQVADYIEAVQPLIGVQKLGSHDAGLTDEERDELGYLKSMMPHRISIENIQRIIELENKKISSAKYEQYQLPGGENYREHVLTLDSHSHNDPYYARNHWGKMKNPLAHIRMSDRVAPIGMPTSQWMDARKRMMNAIGVTNPGALAAGAPDAAVAKGAITPDEARAIAVYYGWTGSKYYKPKKILHVEELQSDWNNDARREGFRTGREQEDYDNFVKEMRQKAKDMIDATPMVRRELEEKYDTLKPHTLAIKLGMADEHRKMRDLVDYPRPPQAPYVNPKSDDWVELALKHVLHEAAQGGYDGITFTPDAEQSKRWGGTDFNGMYDKKFPGIAARLVKQHDPSINPSTMQITQGVQGPMIPLTEQARRGILENGFSSFKKGGYVR